MGLERRQRYSRPKDIRLFNNSMERQRYENMADLYSLFIAMEHLEKAYVRDAISHEELVSLENAFTEER